MNQKKILFLFLLFLFPSLLPAQSGYNMKLIANLNQHPTSGGYSALWGYTAPGGREYAILGAYTGTSFVDITDTNNIYEAGFVPTPYPSSFGNAWREMKVYSHYAYIVTEADNSGVQIVDLGYLPDSVHYVGEFHIPGHTNTHSISQSGPYLYLNGGNNQGVLILDLSVNPEIPVIRGSWNSLYVHDSRIVNDTIWACNISNQSVSIINAVNKDNPQTVTSFLNLPSPASPHNCALTDDRKYLYVTDENNGPGKLKIWNIQDLSNITLERIWYPPGFGTSIIHNVEIYGNYALIAYYTAGVRLLDISDPVNPVEIAWYDTYPHSNGTGYSGCWAAYMFKSGKIIASDMVKGLFVLKQTTDFPSVPSADFTVSNTGIGAGDSIQFFDISSGIPTSWDWVITNGNVTYTSTLKNPSVVFGQTGSYSVRLRVSNSFGTDSIVRNNYITVNNPAMSQFQFTAGTVQTVQTSPTDTSTVKYNWTRCISNLTQVTYKVRFTKLNTGSIERIIPSNNSGADSLITLRKSYLDSLASEFGTTGDSVMVRTRVWAFNGYDSLASSNQLLIILKRTKVGVNLISSEIPGNYDLSQNYPNPFNPTTKINFDLPFSSRVILKVFDMTGREIAILVNGVYTPGYYNAVFDAGNIASGMYFYRLTAVNSSRQHVITKKMMLIR